MNLCQWYMIIGLLWTLHFNVGSKRSLLNHWLGVHYFGGLLGKKNRTTNLFYYRSS